MKVVVDGDNSPGANINGIGKLEPDDLVYIYYASNNKYFRRSDKKEEILNAAKCRVDFVSIPAADNAVDFAIAMDLGTIIDDCPSEVVVLVSDDKHFKTIIARAKEITQNNGLYQVSTIEEAVKRYKMLESSSLQELHKYLSRSFGHETGCEFYGKIDKFFAQKYGSMGKKMISEETGTKGLKKKDTPVEEIKARRWQERNGMFRSKMNRMRSITEILFRC